MFLFDTNHISVWQRGEGAEYEKLCTRLEDHTGDHIFVCIVSFHEMVNGWNAYSVKKGSRPQANFRCGLIGYAMLAGIGRNRWWF